MIEVKATFTKDSVTRMGRNKRIGNYILFPLIAIALLGGGIASLIRGVSGGELVLAIVLCALSPLVLVLCLFMTRSETKTNIQSFGVDKGDVVLDYKFAQNAMQVSRTAEGKTITEAVRYSEFYKVKRTKACFMIYLNKDEVFYVPTDSFVTGTPDELFNLFYEAKVILDY